jgi:uncharacterized protein GlcG (DUF336 family)
MRVLIDGEAVAMADYMRDSACCMSGENLHLCTRKQEETMKRFIILLLTLGITSLAGAQAKSSTDCSGLPDHAKLKAALQQVVKEGQAGNGGLGNQMWGAVVNKDGVVCAVVFTGPDRFAQWAGSRLIAAEKANTANALSLDNFALSTANLYSAAQPGASLYSLIQTNPPNPAAATAGPPEKFGQPDDPMVGKAIGGVVVFGGGFALYSKEGKKLGGFGVSGDTSCTDHVIGWKTRHALGLDTVPLGVADGQTDNIIFDISNGVSSSGFGHPYCKGGKPSEEIAKKLTETHGKNKK